VQIGITDRCNFRCLMCPNHSPLVPGLPPEGQRAQMPLPVLRGLLDDLTRLGGTRWIDLVGVGEPLLHPDFVQFAEEVKRSGFGLCISTNGALLTTEIAALLAEIGVDRINVSINAGSDEVYREVHPGAPAATRQAILASLRAMYARCRELGRPRPAAALSAVVFRRTYRDLPALLDSAAAVGVGYVHLHPLATVPATEDLALDAEEWEHARQVFRDLAARACELGIRTNASAFLAEERPDHCREIYRRIRCYAGHVFSVILADGQVRFCCGCEWTAGDLNQQSFWRIWRSRGYARMRQTALSLPRVSRAPAGCSCFQMCPHAAHNTAIHNQLFPQRRLPTTAPPDARLTE